MFCPKRQNPSEHYLHCVSRERQPGYWQEVEMQILHPPQLLTACLHQHNLETRRTKIKQEETEAVIINGMLRVPASNKTALPPCAGSCPEPPPDSRATLPLKFSRSDLSTTLWPCSRDRPPLALTRPQRASSTQLSTEFSSFFWGCGEVERIYKYVWTIDWEAIIMMFCSSYFHTWMRW